MDDDYAEAYGDYVDWHWWFQGRRRIIELFLDRHTEPEGTDRILAVGGGRFETDLLDGRGRYYNLISSLASRKESTGTGEIVTRGELPDLPFRDGDFDLVCLFDVLEHVKADEESLEELYRVLDPGGHLVLTVPALSFLWSEHDEINGHYRRYNFHGIRRKLETASFEVMDSSYFNTFLFPVVVLLRLVQRMVPGLIDLGGSASFEKNQPGVVNDLLAGLFKLEAGVVRTVRFPFGVSLMVVARKPDGTDREPPNA